LIPRGRLPTWMRAISFSAAASMTAMSPPSSVLT
jgi:hypothetical protein